MEITKFLYWMLYCQGIISSSQTIFQILSYTTALHVWSNIYSRLFGSSQWYPYHLVSSGGYLLISPCHYWKSYNLWNMSKTTHWKFQFAILKLHIYRIFNMSFNTWILHVRGKCQFSFPCNLLAILLQKAIRTIKRLSHPVFCQIVKGLCVHTVFINNSWERQWFLRITHHRTKANCNQW